jgi:hypothetical protein
MTMHIFIRYTFLSHSDSGKNDKRPLSVIIIIIFIFFFFKFPPPPFPPSPPLNTFTYTIIMGAGSSSSRTCASIVTPIADSNNEEIVATEEDQVGDEEIFDDKTEAFFAALQDGKPDFVRETLEENPDWINKLGEVCMYVCVYVCMCVCVCISL